ncbi:MAG: NAD(P)-dependent oxidoreductase [Acetobacteraceae bacterium]|nr:NAD(P)-dependent oxidoreductase [Acetobacteraceae bacterium]
MNQLLHKPVLVTGASGNIGRFLVKRMAEQGWTLRLSDIAPFPDPLPDRATFRRCDLGDPMEVMRLIEGCGIIAHFGGASHDEFPFEDIVNANIRGLYHIYEGARRERARVIFASTNHVTGFHERSEKLDTDCQMLPDSLYGLSKAYGELLAQLYWMKHRVQSVLIRIGSCFPEPSDQRMLSLWLSYPDVAGAVIAAAKADDVGCETIWGNSNNSRSFWRHDDRDRIGWQPQDSADGYADQLLGKVSGKPIAERYQGGIYCDRG